MGAWQHRVSPTRYNTHKYLPLNRSVLTLHVDSTLVLGGRPLRESPSCAYNTAMAKKGTADKKQSDKKATDKKGKGKGGAGDEAEDKQSKVPMHMIST